MTTTAEFPTVTTAPSTELLADVTVFDLTGLPFKVAAGRLCAANGQLSLDVIVPSEPFRLRSDKLIGGLVPTSIALPERRGLFSELSLFFLPEKEHLLPNADEGLNYGELYCGRALGDYISQVEARRIQLPKDFVTATGFQLALGGICQFLEVHRCNWPYESEDQLAEMRTVQRFLESRPGHVSFLLYSTTVEEQKLLQEHLLFNLRQLPQEWKLAI